MTVSDMKLSFQRGMEFYSLSGRCWTAELSTVGAIEAGRDTGGGKTAPSQAHEESDFNTFS